MTIILERPTDDLNFPDLLLVGKPDKIENERPVELSFKPIPNTNTHTSNHSAASELCLTESAREYYFPSKKTESELDEDDRWVKCVECDKEVRYSLGESTKYYHYKGDELFCVELFCRECSWKMDFNRAEKRRKVYKQPKKLTGHSI